MIEIPEHARAVLTDEQLEQFYQAYRVAATTPWDHQWYGVRHVEFEVVMQRLLYHYHWLKAEHLKLVETIARAGITFDARGEQIHANGI